MPQYCSFFAISQDMVISLHNASTHRVIGFHWYTPLEYRNNLVFRRCSLTCHGSRENLCCPLKCQRVFHDFLSETGPSKQSSQVVWRRRYLVYQAPILACRFPLKTLPFSIFLQVKKARIRHEGYSPNQVPQTNIAAPIPPAHQQVSFLNKIPKLSLIKPNIFPKKDKPAITHIPSKVLSKEFIYPSTRLLQEQEED